MTVAAAAHELQVMLCAVLISTAYADIYECPCRCYPIGVDSADKLCRPTGVKFAHYGN